MALQSSGQISFADINTELGRSSIAQIGINEAEAGTYDVINPNSSSRPNGSTPNAINEWYSYDHSAAAPVTFSVSLALSSGGVCNLTTIRVVRSSANNISLSDASIDGAALYRMPQNVLITGYTYVGEYDGNSITSEIFNINTNTGVVGSGTGEFC